MQSPLQHDLPLRGLRSDSACAGYLRVAGVALLGAGVIAVTPIASGLPDFRHAGVTLTAGEVDWSTALSNAQSNWATLQAEAATGTGDLSAALGNVSGHFNDQITAAITGFATGVQNALYGGWYGGDDGYVFGLFGGTVTNPAGVSETGSLLDSLSHDFQTGNVVQAYSDFNAYSLEVVDHTMKPLLSAFVDETSHGVTSYSIPVEMSQIQTSLLTTFGDYSWLKDAFKALATPEISAMFTLTNDLQAISSEFAAGDNTHGMSDLNNLPSDVFNSFVNGYDVGDNPYNGASGLFSGLISSGSLLEHLLLTWPEQFVTALGPLGDSAGSAAADAVGASVSDLLAALSSL